MTSAVDAVCKQDNWLLVFQELNYSHDFACFRWTYEMFRTLTFEPPAIKSFSIERKYLTILQLHQGITFFHFYNSDVGSLTFSPVSQF